MPAPLLSVSRRTRKTPFTNRVTAAGVKAYTVYNHMLLPTVFESVEFDYRHLKTDVQVWDVSCERQVEIRGPDAARLAQMLTPRDLSKMAPDQCSPQGKLRRNGQSGDLFGALLSSHKVVQAGRSGHGYRRSRRLLLPPGGEALPQVFQPVASIQVF